MTIGEEVLIHGYIDEIRKDIVIIRNEGGYFGTVPEEIRSSSEIPNTCGDAISRQAVIDLAVANHTELNGVNVVMYSPLCKDIKQLPPITPQQRTGRWKAFTHSAYHDNDEDGEPIWREVTVYHCNLCNRRTVIKEKYCPNCGAKMQEVEE